MKNIRILPALLLLNMALLLANCIQEINFQEPEANKDELVISGNITNLGGKQILKLTRPGDYNKQYFDPVKEAVIILTDDMGNSWQYLEYDRPDTSHFYFLNNFMGVPGRSYALGVSLPNGQHFLCPAQQMPNPLPLDSMWMVGEQVPLVRSNGSVVQEPHAVMYAAAKRPLQGKAPFVRWDADAVFIFNEIIKIYDPFATQHQCFITSYFNGQNLQLYDFNDLQAGGSIEKYIGKKYIDNAFDHRICFNLYQLTISEEAYRYWQKVAQTLAANGTIFDAPPGPIRGNLLQDGDPSKPALGFFEVAGADIRREFLQSGALGLEFSYLNNYCEYDWSRWPPVNHKECDNCLILPNSTLEIPEYW